MKVLVIEDDQNKLKQICDFLSESDGYVISKKMSYQSGVKDIIENNYDCIILDMTLPTFDKSPTESGGRMRPFGGKEILDKIKRKGYGCPVIVFTGFDFVGEGKDAISLESLNDELERKYRDIYRGYVFYNPVQDDWKNQLNDKLQALIND